MAILIDTTIFIAEEQGHLTLAHFIQANPDQVYVMSVLTASELLVGVHLVSPPHRSARSLKVNSVLQTFRAIPFDLSMAHVHAELVATMQKLGRPVGTIDLMIAATAIALDCEVMSHDQRSFPFIPGLKLIAP